jgi:hypothetical protein
MEPESSLPHSEVPATSPYPEPTLPIPEDFTTSILNILENKF